VKERCPWCLGDTKYVAYHDSEWGVPVHDDTKLFEFLILEGAQAGLSFRTILHKRQGYRHAFAGFDPAEVARFSEDRMEALRNNSEIVRNRLKIRSAVTNARSFLAVRQEFGSFADYLWSFVDGIPIPGAFNNLEEVPTSTPVADRLSRDLKQRGFSFVGPTIMYAYMQAVGLVNDHLVSCFRYNELCRTGR
jgi:DNA-3-methyladenine glycosylase I